MCGSRKRLEDDPTSSQPGKTSSLHSLIWEPICVHTDCLEGIQRAGLQSFLLCGYFTVRHILHQHYFLILRMCELMSRGPFPAELCLKALLSDVWFFCPLIRTQSTSAPGKMENLYPAILQKSLFLSGLLLCDVGHLRLENRYIFPGIPPARKKTDW